MNEENTERRRFTLGTPDKVMLGIVLALVVLTIALLILQRCGLMPVNGAILLYLPLLTLFVLVGWGGSALIRRIKNRTVRLLVGGGLGLALVLVVLLVYTYVTYLSFYLIPQKYTVLSSPSGARRVVVLRTFDTDEDRAKERRAARLANAPEGAPEESIEDWGYLYKAYPRVLGMFYRNNANVEGEVRLNIDESTIARQTGQAPDAGGEDEASKTTHGTLMVEWLEDESVVHFFADNPGITEGGDCYLRF